MMPESGYGFRPTPDVRTFGEQINHATGANYSFCNQAGAPPGFERRNAPSLQSVTTKSAIVKALEDSVAYCSSLIAAASDAWLLESAPNLGGAGSGRITGARAYAFIYAGHSRRRGLRHHHELPAHAGPGAAVDGARRKVSLLETGATSVACCATDRTGGGARAMGSPRRVPFSPTG